MTGQLTFMQFDLGKALKRALGGGLSGAAAMVLQVLLLMVWIPRSPIADVAGIDSYSASSNYHELSVSFWDVFHSSFKDTL